MKNPLDPRLNNYIPAGSRKNSVHPGPVRDHNFSNNSRGSPRDKNNHTLPVKIRNSIFTSVKHFYCGMIDLASGQFDMGGGRFPSLVNMITNGEK